MGMINGLGSGCSVPSARWNGCDIDMAWLYILCIIIITILCFTSKRALLSSRYRRPRLQWRGHSIGRTSCKMCIPTTIVGGWYYRRRYRCEILELSCCSSRCLGSGGWMLIKCIRCRCHYIHRYSVRLRVRSGLRG